MLKEKRWQEIQEILKNDGEVSVRTLAENFCVSEMTIRRDLQGMYQKGLIERIHGGAMLTRGRNLLQVPIADAPLRARRGETGHCPGGGSNDPPRRKNLYCRRHHHLSG